LKESQGERFFVAYVIRFEQKDIYGAHVAQLVEHVLGKDEVISSILIMGSRQFAEKIN
jgi:hypothetical protein